MANYQLLKADIDKKVYQNGEQEITGANLNAVLNAMVTTLGAGYQFAGVATIGTNPENPDAKVFYIANGKGTYTNFGGLEVTEDEVVVLYWDTAWHKVSTGIASNEKLSELGQEVGNIQQLLTLTSGSPIDYYVDCFIKQGTKFIVSVNSITGNASAFSLRFRYSGDEQDTIIGWKSLNTDHVFIAERNIIRIGFYISGSDITSNGDVIFSIRCNLTIRVEELENDNVQNKADIVAINEQLAKLTASDVEELQLSFVNGYYLSGTGGTFNPNNGFKYARVYVDAPAKIKILAEGYGTIVNILSKSYFTFDDEQKEQCRYIEKVRCVDDQLKWYESDITESGYYYICGYANAPIKAFITKNDNFRTKNILAMFPRVITIGDSLSYGAVYHSGGGFYQSNCTIDQAIAKTCGIKSFYIAQAGITTKEWWDKYVGGDWQNVVSGNVPDYTDALGVPSIYVLFLGTNGGLTDTIDTDCPGLDITQYADNNTGSYGKIIKTLIENKLTGVIVVPPTANTETKDAIINLHRKFGFPYIILPDLTNPYYHYDPTTTSYQNAVHYNDMGYAYIGNCIVSAINNLTLSQLYLLLPKYNR